MRGKSSGSWGYLGKDKEREKEMRKEINRLLGKGRGEWEKKKGKRVERGDKGKGEGNEERVVRVLRKGKR